MARASFRAVRGWDGFRAEKDICLFKIQGICAILNYCQIIKLLNNWNCGGKSMTILGFSLYELAAYFLIYSFLGWCLEVIYCAVSTGEIVNRGFLNGPVCPIYGFGMLAVLAALTPLRHSGLALYLGGVLLTTAIELVGGWVLYQVYHTRWWDYSDKPFNIGGYICLEFSLLWGVGTVVVMRVIHPSIARLVSMVPQLVGWVVIGILYAVYAADLVATTVIAKRLSRELDALEEVAESIHVVSDAITQVLGVKALESDQKLDEGKLQLKLAAAEARSAAQRHTAAEKEKLSSRAAAVRTHELAQSAMHAASRAVEAARQSAADAANAARAAAVGTAERTKEIVTQQVDLEQMKAELTARSEAMQAHLLHSNPLFGTRRLLRAFPAMKHGKRDLGLSHFSLAPHHDKTGKNTEADRGNLGDPEE
jgi:uncharacterized membrane protein